MSRDRKGTSERNASGQWLVVVVRGLAGVVVERRLWPYYVGRFKEKRVGGLRLT
jgi:hypothetical protein